jgi:hypothetical protein
MLTKWLSSLLGSLATAVIPGVAIEAAEAAVVTVADLWCRSCAEMEDSMRSRENFSSCVD